MHASVLFCRKLQGPFELSAEVSLSGLAVVRCAVDLLTSTHKHTHTSTHTHTHKHTHTHLYTHMHARTHHLAIAIPCAMRAAVVRQIGIKLPIHHHVIMYTLRKFT